MVVLDHLGKSLNDSKSQTSPVSVDVTVHRFWWISFVGSHPDAFGFGPRDLMTWDWAWTWKLPQFLSAGDMIISAMLPIPTNWKYPTGPVTAMLQTFRMLIVHSSHTKKACESYNSLLQPRNINSCPKTIKTLSLCGPKSSCLLGTPAASSRTPQTSILGSLQKPADKLAGGHRGGRGVTAGFVSSQSIKKTSKKHQESIKNQKYVNLLWIMLQLLFLVKKVQAAVNINGQLPDLEYGKKNTWSIWGS